MKFDNQKKAIRVSLNRMFIAIIFTILIIVVLVSGWFDKQLLGLEKGRIALIVLGVYVLINIYKYLLDLNYIFYSDDTDKIVIRYYPLRPFSTRKRKSIEIPKQLFVRFRIKSMFFGQKKKLILYQAIKNTVAKYPPISISSLNSEELQKLTDSLTAHSRK